MRVLETVEAVRAAVKNAKLKEQEVGLVPTMGFLHDGHLSLMKRARIENELVVVSIFVNPTQFGPNEDLESYPRDLTADLAKCESVGVDIVFTPSVSEMYPTGYSTYVNAEGNITRTLCGASREGHFKGVTSVVTKLFHIVAPTRAYFGQKDAQQVAVIQKMVRDLNFDLEIVPCAIVREADGLAMSSRNTYLSESQRKEALVLSQSLKIAKQAIDLGVKEAVEVIESMKKHIATSPSAAVEYIQIVDAQSLEDLDVIQGEVLIAMAVRIGKTRLIDNMRFTLSQ
ncbi:MAG: pantoate--beta-alanine ligase [Clostridiales bacterium]|jgi:pantoate--beta-alanine ligase|nr:pantoate--beta-alanine ligase [Clostridiales bacterium]